MALDTFENLKQAIERFTHRTDLSDVIDDLVSLAENRINSYLRVTTNNLRATASASTSDRFLQLPDRFQEMRRLTLIQSNRYHELGYLTPESMRLMDTAGIPRYFTVTSQIEFDRVPADTYTIEMSYWAKLNPLSTSNTTNNVLTNYPHIYLSACKVEVYDWASNQEESQKEETKLRSLIDEANAQDLSGRYGPAPVMRTESPTP